VDNRPKPQKNTNLNSPKSILFAIQRKIPRFPQEQKLQLATLFPVCLRELPFSELAPKIQIPKNHSKTASIPVKLALSRRPIIKGPHTDLILSVTRYL
jgi:hypothetical protein